MEQTVMNESNRDVIKEKLCQSFDGKIVRKDLTKKIKEGANVSIYVLEFLLGQHCCFNDEEVIEKGVQSVKRVPTDNFVRPDEAQRISNLGLGNVPIEDEYPEQYGRLLCGGIWCIPYQSAWDAGFKALGAD